MKDEHQPFAILWASMGAIYQRFGYGLASTQIRYKFDPRQAAFAFDEPLTGSVELVNKDDALAILKPLFIGYAAPRNLYMHRAPAMWQGVAFRPQKKGEPIYYAVHRDDEGTRGGTSSIRRRVRTSLAQGHGNG